MPGRARAARLCHKPQVPSQPQDRLLVTRSGLLVTEEPRQEGAPLKDHRPDKRFGNPDREPSAASPRLPVSQPPSSAVTSIHHSHRLQVQEKFFFAPFLLRQIKVERDYLASRLMGREISVHFWKREEEEEDRTE